MFDNYKEAESFVIETYGLGLKYYCEESASVSYGETVIEDGRETDHDVKGGEYTYYDFIDPTHVIYKLIYFPLVSTNNPRIIRLIQDEEMRDVKEWELLPQKVEHKHYIMYKLVPFTVQGLPTYS